MLLLLSRKNASASFPFLKTYTGKYVRKRKHMHTHLLGHTHSPSRRNRQEADGCSSRLRSEMQGQALRTLSGLLCPPLPPPLLISDLCTHHPSTTFSLGVITTRPICTWSLITRARPLLPCLSLSLCSCYVVPPRPACPSIRPPLTHPSINPSTPDGDGGGQERVTRRKS